MLNTLYDEIVVKCHMEDVFTAQAHPQMSMLGCEMDWIMKLIF
jgi:hypothetical protein